MLSNTTVSKVAVLPWPYVRRWALPTGYTLWRNMGNWFVGNQDGVSSLLKNLHKNTYKYSFTQDDSTDE